MTKIQDLENKLRDLYILKNDKTKSAIFDILDKNIDDIQKEINILKSKKNSSTKNELRIKLSILIDKRKNTECLATYTSLNKEIREIRFELKELEGDIKYLSITQINALIKAIQKHSNFILRDKLLVLLGFELGLRASEILNLKMSDIYLDSDEILCRRLKGSTQSKIEVSSDTMKLLKIYISEEKPTDLLFSNSKGTQLTLQGLNSIVKRYCEFAKIPKDKAHYHILKHSRGKWLAENGFSIQAIQFLLGHKSIKNTMVYARFSSSQKLDIYNQLRNTPNHIKL
ncbi:tyrosine-type recombinase/integrase [Cetobacterium sp. 2A]|uniref:tyrosine-type recombinase/integrase n=1 Tax=Cetobacterium sp. 2A TaxID=2754723 RepID=UPI00163D1D0A|nr:tyrosine-type recombinase/integrase [Cetobacterium sp. 2A]MBC2856823.1 tyrosine-type recombinase/integrase [Cetobacterium sp. 2A]